MAYNLGTAQGQIRVEYDSTGMRRYRDDTGRFVSEAEAMQRMMGRTDNAASRNTSSMGRLGGALRALGKGFLVMTKYVTIASVAIQSLASSAHLIAGILAAIAPAVGAGLALLPGIILAAVSAMLVLKAAMAGVGDALKAAVSGDAAKLAEATKGLAPNAAAFAVAVGVATKALKPMQQAIQNATFAGLAGQVPGITAGLKSVQAQAVGVGTSFSGIANQFGKFLQSSAFVDAVRASLQTVKGILDSITPGILPLLTGFANLAKHGLDMVTAFSGAGAALGKFGDFLGKFDIAGAFQKAGEALSPLIALAKDLGAILSTVFSAFSGPAGNALGLIGELVAKVADFARSQAGVEAFNALGRAISAIAGSAGDVLLSLLEALGPAVAAIAPLFTVLGRVLGSVLTTAIAALAPLVLELAQALNASLGPILPVIGDALRVVIAALQPLLGTLISGLTPVLIALSPVISALATALGGMLAAALEQITPILAELMPVFLNLAEQVGPQLVLLIGNLAKGFIAAAPAMFPMINLLVGSLVPVLNVVIPLLSYFIAGLATLIGWLAAIIGPIASFIGAFIQASQISAIITAVFNTVRTVVENVIRGAVQFVQQGIAGMKVAFSSLASAAVSVGQTFNNIKQAIINGLTQALGAVARFPGQVASALSGMGSLLFGAGQDLINGFINGIRSMAGRAAQAARDAVAAVPAAIKGALGISSPSKVAAALGREVPRGLALGILDTMDLIRRAAETAAAQVTIGLPRDFSASVSSAVTASFGAGNGTSSAPSPAPAASAAAGTVINQTVNAPQNMSPSEVARLAAARLALTISTGAVAPAV
jgi:phage-related protein